MFCFASYFSSGDNFSDISLLSFQQTQLQITKYRYQMRSDQHFPLTSKTGIEYLH